MRFPFAACLSVAALVLCVGCGDEEKPKEVVNPLLGEKITVVVPTGLGLEQAWELSLAEWKQRTGAEYELKDAMFGQGHDFPEADLILMPVSEIPSAAAAGKLRALDPQRRDSPGLGWNDLFKGLRNNVASRYKGPVALPISCPVLVCYYRADLLEAAGLAPPRTWSEYQKLAETVDEWAGGLPVVEPWCEEFRATMFLARAMAYVKHPDEYSTTFDIRTGEPLIDTPGFARGLEVSLATLKSMPTEVLNYDTQDCRREFVAGRASMAIAFETGYGNPPVVLTPSRQRTSPESAEPRAAEVKIGFAPLPGASEVYYRGEEKWVAGSEAGVNVATLTGFGGLCAVVSTKTSEKTRAAAWNLVEFLTNPNEFARTFPPQTRSLCRASQMSSPDLWLPDDLSASEGGSYLGEVSRALQSESLVVELSVIGRDQFRASLTEGLTSALNGETNAAETLQNIAGKWREIADSLGRQQVRDSYRSGLGLRPLGEDK